MILRLDSRMRSSLAGKSTTRVTRQGSDEIDADILFVFCQLRQDILATSKQEDAGSSNIKRNDGDSLLVSLGLLRYQRSSVPVRPSISFTQGKDLAPVDSFTPQPNPKSLNIWEIYSNFC